jgi:hypothetical protein
MANLTLVPALKPSLTGIAILRHLG